MSVARFVLRVIARTPAGEVTGVIEQDIPATEAQIFLALRRWHFKSAIAVALLEGGTVTLSRRGKR